MRGAAGYSKRESGGGSIKKGRCIHSSVQEKKDRHIEAIPRSLFPGECAKVELLFVRRSCLGRRFAKKMKRKSVTKSDGWSRASKEALLQFS